MNNPARKRSGLGRGLASLIPTGPAEDGEPSTFGPRMGSAAADVVLGGPTVTPQPEESNPAGAVYREIDPAQIEPNPRQPRQVFDEESLAELVHSIREFGLMQPIVVRAAPASPDDAAGAPRYQLVMGERRWRAAQEAGVATIPAIVRETADDSMLRDALLGPLAERHHRDHGSDTDDDAQRGQNRAQYIRPDRPHGDDDDLENEHGLALPATATARHTPPRITAERVAAPHALPHSVQIRLLLRHELRGADNDERFTFVNATDDLRAVPVIEADLDEPGARY